MVIEVESKKLMAGSLFDNRYRYDYIYPRGRSGETLRAVDTQDGERPVVIKRPAPQDAPPIRFGQEVSILNERKALTRLAGHAVVTALLGSGQFTIGGMAHQYIVMERAQGVIVADHVLELAGRGERLPELEMLVIIDSLLDLLFTAHAHDIVYNDVDAKHLFWDRDAYRLKVIDWGNAVFLEGDDVTAQGISRQTDVFQVGELLYFILTGGGRLESPRDAGAEFRVNFGHDAEHIHSRLAAIISRAAHPSPRLRYGSIAELRKDLADYRSPLERERNSTLGRVNERLRRDLSKDELNGSLKMLDNIFAIDPGYPPARTAREEILNRLSDLEIDADLDAARIYLESGSWARAISVLEELAPRARNENARQIALLLDWAKLAQEANLRPTPHSVLDAITLLFEGHIDRAAYRLLTENQANDTLRNLQLQLAERISAHLPDILLLRPNLYRLEIALGQLASEAIPVAEPRSFLTELYRQLDRISDPNDASLIRLRDGYSAVVDQINRLGVFLESVREDHALPNTRLPLSALTRALNASMALADYMHVIGKQATGSPRDALSALDSARAIDPSNRSWDAVRGMLGGLYELLGVFQQYIPSADASDLENWLKQTEAQLEPYVERLFDETLVGMVVGLRLAGQSWQAYADAVIQGNRSAATMALQQATESISTVSPALAGWLNQLRAIINNASYIERNALYGALGRALADGWENFDRGRLPEAERLGITAYESARSDAERFAARRLRDLSELLRDWLERSGVASLKATQTILTKVELLYTPDEIGARDNFAAQMPTKETFIKAMTKGLVEVFARQNTAANRVLFANYTLFGVLEAYEDHLDDARFWRDAAVKALGEFGARHPATKALEDMLDRRRDLIAAAELLNSISSPYALPGLEASRRALEENPQAKSIAPAVYSLRELEAAARDWSDGEFRAAGIKLENAIRAVDEIETTAGITLTTYRAFLMELLQGAADLHAAARKMVSTIERRPDEPVDFIRHAHQQMVENTSRLLGASYAATLRTWAETYESFLSVYTDPASRRSAKLSRFNDQFRALFIDRHPAYPLYRHWYSVTEEAPEFPAPPTNEPTPRIAEEADITVPDEDAQSRPPRAPRTPRSTATVPDEEDDEPRPRRRGRAGLIIGLGVGLLIVLAAVFLLNNNPELLAGSSDGLTLTANSVLAAAETDQAVALAVTETVEVSAPTELPTNADPTETRPQVVNTIAPRGSETALPSRTPSITPTFTASSTFTATFTLTATNTPLPTNTPTRTATPTPTLPPQGLQGEQDVLPIAAELGSPELFTLGQDGTYYRMGTGSPSNNEVYTLALPAEFLDIRYGGNPAARISSVQVTIELATWNPPLVLDDDVYFGVVLMPADDAARAVGVQLNLVQDEVYNIARRVGNQVNVNAQRGLNGNTARIRLERDGDMVALYVNNEQIGEPIPLADDNVIPAVYVKEGGVVIYLRSWSVTLR